MGTSGTERSANTIITRQQVENFILLILNNFRNNIIKMQTLIIIFFSIRLENREVYTRSKSSMLNRRTVEGNNSIGNKSSGQSKPPQQRARTASMPAENRKVKCFGIQL
jgi:hypothetical protein